MKKMTIITLDDIIKMHKDLTEIHGGDSDIRDIGLLESALIAPWVTYHYWDAEDLHYDAYPTLHEKAAVLCYHLIKNHPFYDGNKRIGVHSMLVFLKANNLNIPYTDNDLVNLGIGIASGEIDQAMIGKWIIGQYSKTIENPCWINTNKNSIWVNTGIITQKDILGHD